MSIDLLICNLLKQSENYIGLFALQATHCTCIRKLRVKYKQSNDGRYDFKQMLPTNLKTIINKKMYN